jgi:phage terminase large subunit-like protein
VQQSPPAPSPEEVKALAKRAEQALERRRLENRLAAYVPYAKQKAFHDAGRLHRERLLRAGNQLGKTVAGCAEAAMHLTGEYPPWWQGRRWERAVTAWAGSPTAQTTRDTVQRLLLGAPGDPSAFGTGLIPKKAIVDVSPARGVPDAVESVRVRHVAGGVSRLVFKTYDQGRERWQGETLDFVYFDEEPEMALYTEGLSRTNATKGMAYMTFTPLLGISDVVMRFLREPSPDRSDTVMTIEDAEHIPVEERERIIASYPAHEREARTRGVPILGSGRVFPVARSLLSVEAFKIPDWWGRLGAIDFGWTHPTAAVRIAYDRDADLVYVTDCYRVKEMPIHTHAAALKAWGADLPWA